MSLSTRREALDELRRRGEPAQHRSLRESFRTNPERARSLTFDAAGLHIDCSKQLISIEDVASLIRFAHTCDVEQRRDEMFSGGRVNRSEDRGALHVLHRADGAPGLNEVRVFVDALRGGAILGATGAPLRAIVNLGIGGSDLGPRMATRALAAFIDGAIDVRFASSLDPRGLEQALEGIEPAEVLFVAATKSFSTQETGVLAHRAIDWLRRSLGEQADISLHLAAVTSRPDLAARAGIRPDRTFSIDEGIGGRYSLTSAMGLCVMAAVGTAVFDEMLSGFESMDQHFATAPLDANLPVLHGLISVWNRSILGFGAQAVVPFSWDLRLVPEHLAQLVMESNGKSVDEDGTLVDLATSPVLFGAPGTEAQHSFFQLLHQGTDRVPVDLIGVVRGSSGPNDALLANLLAQANALAFGRSLESLIAEGVSPEIAAQRAMPGNRPSTTILIDEVTPASLGALIALYEHSVFVQAMLWNINPFDQFGVELGKDLARDLAPQLVEGAPAPPQQDGSTTDLVAWIRARR